MNPLRLVLLGLVIAVASGCKGDNGDQGMMDFGAGGGGGGGGGMMVSGHARILHGPSTIMHAAGRIGPQPQAAADGHWALSPDQTKVTVVNLSFQGDQPGSVQAVTLTNCTPTYMRDQPALTPVLDCPFEIPAGTYVSMAIGVSTTFDVLISDAANGFFTDPNATTKLSSTAPTGGAQFVSVTVPGPAGGGMGNVLMQQTYFTHPIAVTPTGSVGGGDGGTTPGITVDIVEDMVHTVFANVSGGVASFDTSLPFPPVQMMASIEGAGRVAFYSESGTAGDAIMPGPTDDESTSVRLFYDGTGAASYLFHPTVGPSQAWNANPANSPVTGFRAGGYLGIDASGTLCWAIPQDYSYAQYVAICEMKAVSATGATTTINCQTTSNVPPPTSGDTYASGCPAITPTSSMTLTLVAQ